MAYFEIKYLVHDETNTGVIYKLDKEEAKEMVVSGRGKLWDKDTLSKVEAPTDWFEKKEQSVEEQSVENIQFLQKKYEDKFEKELPYRYKNDLEWIKSKLYS